MKYPIIAKILLFITAVLLCNQQTTAQSLNARFSTSLYSWERQLTESENETHLRLYQTFQFTVGQLADNRLSFHTFGAVSHDLAESADDDPIPRLYNAYLQWRGRKGIVDRIKVGRQRIYSGVAYGTIDGIDLNLTPGKWLKIGGFVGFLTPVSTDIEVANWDDRHAFGLRVGTNDLLGTKILISFMQRNNRPAAYEQPGRFTQQLLTFESLEQRLFGVDFYRPITRNASFYGRFDYDLEQERVRRTQFELRLSPTPRLQVVGEFFHRAPFIAANSIFTVFEQNTTQDAGLRLNYRVSQTWFVDGNLGVVFYDGDETVRFGLGLRSRYGTVGYNFRRGYGGMNNGLYASFNYPLISNWTLLATTGLARYSLFNEDTDEYTSLSGSVGMNYRPDKRISVDFLAQGVRNRFLDSDFRFFVKANYWIFNKF